MLKKNNWLMAVTSLITLPPIAVGVLLWDKLPDVVATHWGLDGEPNGWSKKWVVVFGMPVFVCALHWLCASATTWDKRNRNQNEKVLRLLLWICPVVSWFVFGSIYAVVLGKSLNVSMIVPVFLGTMFIVIGNYLPKCKRNRTIGIKVKWTLESEENWNATHRMAGRLWVIGGLLLLAGAFLPEAVLTWWEFGLMLVLVLVPIVYSYRYSKKNP